ncbi:MAG: imelysin family protein [Bacteroidota bacterium]
MNLRLIQILFLSLLVTAFMGCSDDDMENNLDERFQAAAENYATIVLANYEDSFNEASELRDLINDFVADPTEAKFEACKNQWLAARIPYGQTEVFRFYGGPIDDDDGPEGLLNAWPMDENFIDYVEGDAMSGLINDPVTYPEITKALLEGLNESFTEESIFTGYHAIEFLLWGQDLFTSSAGQRPYTDYVVGGTADNQARRGEYLKVVADLLLDHLDSVKSEWEADGAYRATFLNFSKKEIITKIFTALGELSKGELSGERMFVAVDEQDQENEHSCFADNTNVDIEQNFQGLVNVYTGTYTRTNGSVISGESYSNLAAEITGDKDQVVLDAIDNARQKINAIPDPFDQAILNSADVVLKAVTALEDLSDAFVDVQVELENN